MINEDSITELSQNSFSFPNTCLPCYDGYCLSNIPNTILKMFGINHTGTNLPKAAFDGFDEKPTNIILILLDAFGWNSFEKYVAQLDFFKRFESYGIISKITSQFPSTTAVNIPTINTGVPVTQHCLMEWFYYDSRVGCNILPLLNAIVEPEYVVNSATDRTGLNISSIYPESFFNKKLNEAGIDSYVCNPVNFKKSKINQLLLANSKWVDGEGIDVQLNNLLDILNGSKRRKYAFIYEPRYDSFCHRCGFASKQTSDFTREFFTLLDNFIAKIKDDNTYIIFTADHGIKDCSKTIYLDEMFPSLRNYIKRDHSNNLITPTGGPSDWFLYVNQPEEVKNFLSVGLDGIAKILSADEVIKYGFFGSDKIFSSTFINNLPNLFVFSISDVSFSWRGKEEGYLDDEQWIGVHGGISRSEMESLFMLLKV